MKLRNPSWGCPRIAQQISLIFGIVIDKDIVRRILSVHDRPGSGSSGPSWLTFLGHAKDSLWSCDLFRCESATLRTHWVLVVMDQFTRRIIGFGVHCGTVHGAALCWMFCRAVGRHELAHAFGVSERTVRKWVSRFRAEGAAGLRDRSSRPHCSPRRTEQRLEEEVERLRRLRWTCDRIAHATGLSTATVSRILRRLGLNRLKSLEPAEPVQRYEHKLPGDLLHLDIKKLARIGVIGHRITGDRRRRAPGIGWEFLHVAIDDHSRIAFSQIQPNECGSSAAAFRVQVKHRCRVPLCVDRVEVLQRANLVFEPPLAVVTYTRLP